jgi:DNA-binding NarL/FixJ family response regulator
VLLSDDLMLVAAAQGNADRHSVELVTAGSKRAALDAALDVETRLVVIDLRLPDVNVAELVPGLRNANPQMSIVACGPHVHEQALASAAAAGCDEVITRGQFDRRLDALLAELTARKAAERSGGSY